MPRDSPAACAENTVSANRGQPPRFVFALPATLDSKGQRWAACPRCGTGHLLGRFTLDEWEPSVRVPWPCPDVSAPTTVVAVDPALWLEPGEHLHWRKIKHLEEFRL